MSPILLTLYALILTLLLVLFLPRLQDVDPRALRVSLVAGVAVLLLALVLAFAS